MRPMLIPQSLSIWYCINATESNLTWLKKLAEVNATHATGLNIPNLRPQMTTMFWFTSLPQPLQSKPSWLSPDHLPQRVAKVVSDLSLTNDSHLSQKQPNLEVPSSNQDLAAGTGMYDMKMPPTKTWQLHILGEKLITLAALLVALVSTGFPQRLIVMVLLSREGWMEGWALWCMSVKGRVSLIFFILS